MQAVNRMAIVLNGCNGRAYSMPVLYDARGLQTIPQPIGWKATASLLGSSAIAALFMLCLLLLTIG
jgi:hypothetical protein